MFNRTAGMILGLALLAGLGLVAAQKMWMRTEDNTHSLPEAGSVMFYPTARAVPEFSLNQPDGSVLTSQHLRGYWTLVFIGFTSCPDVCPLTLHTLARAQKQWQNLSESTRPRLLFVSIDPQRDTPERLQAYAHAFHADTLVATADEVALEKFSTALGLVFMKVPGRGFATNPDDYSMDHSATIAVLNPEGQWAGVMRPPFDPQLIAADFLRLTGATP